MVNTADHVELFGEMGISGQSFNNPKIAIQDNDMDRDAGRGRRTAESDIELSPEDHDDIVENLQELSYFD